MSQRYQLIISYDGSAYGGWQIQPDNRTIQGELEACLHTLCGERPRVNGSGRTDAGVHARAQVAHFDLDTPMEPRRLRRGLNGLLNDDIRIHDVNEVGDDFYARFSNVGKEYRYCIWNDAVVPPFLRLYRTHVRKPLDIDAMNQAAMLLEGEHDFAAFSANPNREIDGTVRTLYALTVRKRGHDITLIARGDGFLYKMVRSLAGFLIRVGAGEQSPEMAREILESKVRTARVPTAAARGLFLWKVFYPKSSST
ncbi:MAG: tRNA pseudouridine(38-40) synthase TruA [Spartobacteria bacterium]|nr:tRNA pseudouridine(38-40) synthase TruA [Spartobacteria bacterium]